MNYTKKDGSVKRYRAKYKNQTKNGLVVLPDEDVYKVIKYLEIQRAAEGKAQVTNNENEGSISVDLTPNTKQQFNGADSHNMAVIWGIK